MKIRDGETLFLAKIEWKRMRNKPIARVINEFRLSYEIYHWIASDFLCAISCFP